MNKRKVNLKVLIMNVLLFIVKIFIMGLSVIGIIYAPISILLNIILSLPVVYILYKKRPITFIKEIYAMHKNQIPINIKTITELWNVWY